MVNFMIMRYYMYVCMYVCDGDVCMLS